MGLRDLNNTFVTQKLQILTQDGAIPGEFSIVEYFQKGKLGYDNKYPAKRFS